MTRQLKILVIIGFFAAALCGFSRAGFSSPPKGDGRLSLYSYRANETVEVVIHSNGTYDTNGLAKVNNLMRCRGNDSVFPIDRRLVDLIDNIQDHFGVDTIEIISGYRSPAFNRTLKQKGHNVARESLHTKGLAADIHIDEISEEAVWKYVKSLGVGGAGLYPCYDFVHVDIGRQATWAEPDCAQRKLVGLDLNPNPEWKIITNKNNYRRGDTILFTVEHLRGVKGSPAILLRGGPPAVGRDSSKVYSGNTRTAPAHIEKFKRGVWENIKAIDFSSRKVITKGLPYGKYRIVYQTNPPTYSNEFYVKKQ